jgi:holo-[acyl-carrier protein] synthase
MPIVGHGIDIVETSRIRRMVEEHGAHFLDRVYTPSEQAYCARNPKRYVEHLAGRFAAKEAVLKVIGTGWRGGIAWTDIEIRSEPSGQPVIHLTGECQRIATEQGIITWHVSISHIETHATASAIGVK